MGGVETEVESESTKFDDTELWRVTDGAERELTRAEKERFHIMGVLAGLEKCQVCGESAKICLFGLEGNGVWIGCDRSVECARNIEYHQEGWSIDDVAECWNHRNSGLNWLIRKVKGWFRGKFGERAREWRRKDEEAREREESDERRRREVFGIAEAKRGSVIGRIVKRVFRKRG